jgi:ABC-type transport system involved in cytochrome c biogenesis permease subunit
MADGSVMVLVSGGLFLLAALGYLVRREAGDLLGAAGAAVLVGALGARGVRAGYWPLTNQYEFTLAFALGTSLVSLAMVVQQGRPGVIRAATMLLCALLIVLARLGMPSFRRAIRPLSPALDSIWLPLHVGAAALSYGALAMTGAAGAVQLVWRRCEAEAEGLSERAVAVGYPLLTLSMLLGMVWAQQAWGRYWGWDPKETWTLITWLLYTLYWHLRKRPKWRGRRLAWLAMIGLGSALFTLFGVGWLARRIGLESLYLF